MKIIYLNSTKTHSRAKLFINKRLTNRSNFQSSTTKTGDNSKLQIKFDSVTFLQIFLFLFITFGLFSLVQTVSANTSNEVDPQQVQIITNFQNQKSSSKKQVYIKEIILENRLNSSSSVNSSVNIANSDNLSLPNDDSTKISKEEELKTQNLQD